MAALEKTEPEKFRLLAEFEAKVRAGALLQRLDEFRTFMKLVGKDVLVGKSKKEALPKLMAALARMDLEGARAVLTKVPTRTAESSDTVYSRLADHIISSGPGRSRSD